MSTYDESLQELVTANRILAREGVVDAFGHVSVRHPDDPERYIMACSRAPGLVVRDDLMEYTLDGDPFDQRDRLMYAERHIHGAIYETRPDVHAVIHNHSLAVIPFGVTGVRLRPVIHVGSTMGTVVPVWDIREKFGDTSLLVLNMEQGRDLAGCFGDGRVALMRGHGCVVGCADVKAAVMVAAILRTAAGTAAPPCGAASGAAACACAAQRRRLPCGGGAPSGSSTKDGAWGWVLPWLGVESP